MPAAAATSIRAAHPGRRADPSWTPQPPARPPLAARSGGCRTPRVSHRWVGPGVRFVPSARLAVRAPRSQPRMARGALATAPTTERRQPASARTGNAASTAAQRNEILVRRMIALPGPLERTTTLRFVEGSVTDAGGGIIPDEPRFAH